MFFTVCCLACFLSNTVYRHSHEISLCSVARICCLRARASGNPLEGYRLNRRRSGKSVAGIWTRRGTQGNWRPPTDPVLSPESHQCPAKDGCNRERFLDNREKHGGSHGY